MKQFSLIIALFLGYTISISAANLSQNSVLASGNWIKVATTNEGIHKITYQNLNSWGISNPSNVAVYTNGGYMLPEYNNISYPDDLSKIPVIHGKDYNNNDCIFFYSTGIVKWTYNDKTSLFEHTRNLYSDYTYFFITSDNQKSNAPLVNEIANQLADTTFSTYNGYKLYEKELSNIHNSGRVWYGDDVVSPYGINIDFSFDDIADNTATMRLSATAASDVASEFQISLNDQRLNSTMRFSSKIQEKAFPELFTKTITAAASMNFRLDFYSNQASGKAWIDYLTINRKLKLKFNSDQLLFRNSDARKYEWVEFDVNSENDNLILLDVTNPLDAREIRYAAVSNTLQFTDEGGDIKNYVVFDPKSNSLPGVSFVENIENQNIHGESDFDMIIVSHPDFVSASERLADFHIQNDGLSVLVLETPKIFNEFSSGAEDVSGIRNMIRYFYRKAEANGNELKYVLLMGDGSFDNKGINQSTTSNYIPTYQSNVDTSDGTSITSDDFYALLDENEGALSGRIDIGIGRIPCENINEANLVVDKIIQYVSPETFGNWKNIISFWSDDEDNNEHMSNTEKLVSIVEENYTGFYIDKIYFDSFKQVSSSEGDTYPEVNKRINQQVNEGALILNYVGHASPIAAAAERILTLSDISSWSNNDKLPVFVTATCEFSRFDDTKKSAGEEILFHPAGGGVALFSTTRIVYSDGNLALSSNFYANAFKKDDNGYNLRMGDIMKLAKNATNDGGNRRSFALLGDPALRLAFPTYKVNTKSINGQTLDEPVQVGAMEKVLIEGEVSNHNNDVYTNFNGTVDITVYDKDLKTKTLANDGGNPYEYEIQNNIIYKGKATVENGTFEFSFVVPKDISYSVGNGNIYYYAYNEHVDGHGSCDKIVIGGSGSNPVIDNSPPDVQLYINNENFKNYDKIASNALLIVRVFDESGINTVGTGIGHDATAVLNDDNTSQIVLNDYYEADANSYQEGTIVYPLTGLESGEHKLSVKIWDVQNQSTTAEIYFIVDDEFKITNVSNYPNPVQFNTNFYIEHNLPGHVFDAQLDIFNLAGQKIHQSMQKISSNNTVENTIEWDISQSTTHIPRRAILVYRILLQNSEGQKATGTGKMIINY